jgi:hypothetical protein
MDLGHISWRGILILLLLRNCPIPILSVSQHDQYNFQGFPACLIPKDVILDFFQIFLGVTFSEISQIICKM